MNRITILFISFFILLVSCGNSDRNQIEDLLSNRQKAFETKNVNLYLSGVSPEYSDNYNGKRIGIEDIKKRFLSNVSIFDSVKIRNRDISVYIDNDKAIVVQKAEVKLKIENDGSLYKLNERISFGKVDGRWRIVKESDADFLEGFVFGG